MEKRSSRPNSDELTDVGEQHVGRDDNGGCQQSWIHRGVVVHSQLVVAIALLV